MEMPKEVEFKYRADKIALDKFKEYCIAKSPSEYTMVSGHDHFFSNPNLPDCFWRHRIGPQNNQLTFKRKTSPQNSFIRIEHNIDLDNNTELDKVDALCTDLGFPFNTTIFKTSFIYVYDWYILAYYIVYDINMKETGRFIEIEIREDAGIPEKQAWSELVVLEKSCRTLGLTSKDRVTESLFEIYRR